MNPIDNQGTILKPKKRGRPRKPKSEVLKSTAIAVSDKELKAIEREFGTLYKGARFFAAEVMPWIDEVRDLVANNKDSK